MKTLVEKMEETFEIKFDDKTRARLDRYEEAAIERGELATDLFESFLEFINDRLDEEEAKISRS